VGKIISLKEAIKFHGHLGPYLVLGLKAGEVALRRLKCNKYFGLEVKIWGAAKKPKACFIDGLQLSTGATYGKNNIHKFNGSVIKAQILNLNNHKIVAIKFKPHVTDKINSAKTHKDCEVLAIKLYKTNYSKLFNLKLTARRKNNGTLRTGHL